MCAIDITAEQRKTVLALLARHLPNTTAWVYGSRVKWTSRPESDLDLVVFATPAQAGRVSDLREAFEESNLPFRVDLFVWDAVPEQFRKQIEAEHVVLVERREPNVSGEWPTVQLGEVVDLLTGFPFKSDRYVNDPEAPRLLRGDNIGQGTLRWSGAKRWSLEAIDTLRPFWLRADDVVLAMDRPWIEAGLKFSAVRTVDLPALLVQRVARLRGSTRLDTRFLNYVIGCRDFTEHVISVQTGTAVPHISARQIKEFEFLLPPLPEQRAIAHILGTLDDKVELNQRMNQTLEEMARALFKSWFVDFDSVRAKATLKHHAAPLPQGGSDWSVERARAYLDRMDPNIAALFPDRFVDSELGPIPAGWEVKTIGDIVRRISVGKKYSQKTAAESGIVPILDQGKSGIIGYHNDKPGVTASTSEPIIVFANHTCYMRLIMHDFSAIQNVLPFEGKNHNIYWLFCATIRKQEFIEYKGHWPDFLIKEIVVPERTLQSKFGRVVAAFFRQAHINDSQSRTLTALRDALLPKLVSGEIRVADAKKQVEAIA